MATIAPSDAEAVAASQVVTDACALASMWVDLDWEDAIDALDRIRHAVEPTPPIEAL